MEYPGRERFDSPNLFVGSRVVHYHARRFALEKNVTHSELITMLIRIIKAKREGETFTSLFESLECGESACSSFVQLLIETLSGNSDWFCSSPLSAPPPRRMLKLLACSSGQSSPNTHVDSKTSPCWIQRPLLCLSGSICWKWRTPTLKSCRSETQTLHSWSQRCSPPSPTCSSSTSSRVTLSRSTFQARFSSSGSSSTRTTSNISQADLFVDRSAYLTWSSCQTVLKLSTRMRSLILEHSTRWCWSTISSQRFKVRHFTTLPDFHISTSSATISRASASKLSAATPTCTRCTWSSIKSQQFILALHPNSLTWDSLIWSETNASTEASRSKTNAAGWTWMPPSRHATTHTMEPFQSSEQSRCNSQETWRFSTNLEILSREFNWRLRRAKKGEIKRV